MSLDAKGIAQTEGDTRVGTLHDPGGTLDETLKMRRFLSARTFGVRGRSGASGASIGDQLQQFVGFSKCPNNSFAQGLPGIGNGFGSYTCRCIYRYVHTYRHIHIPVPIQIHVYVRVYIYKHIYIYIYACSKNIYIYIPGVVLLGTQVQGLGARNGTGPWQEQPGEVSGRTIRSAYAWALAVAAAAAAAGCSPRALGGSEQWIQFRVLESTL